MPESNCTCNILSLFYLVLLLFLAISSKTLINTLFENSIKVSGFIDEVDSIDIAANRISAWDSQHETSI